MTEHAAQSPGTLGTARSMEDGLGAGENDLSAYFHKEFGGEGRKAYDNGRATPAVPE